MNARFVFLSAGCALVATSIAAQSLLPGPIPDPQRSTPARFEIAPAGARTVGLGGAFVAVADDATAADTNPAGLALLESTQAQMGVRSTSFDTEFSGGLAPGIVTHGGSASGPAFAGFAHPMGTVTYGVYYQRDAEFSSDARFEEGVFFAEWYPYNVFDVRRYGQQLETLGASAAATIAPTLSAGLTVRQQRLSVQWEDDQGLDFLPFPQQPFGGPPFVGSRTVVDDDETDVTAVLGLLYHPEGPWKGGLCFQQGASFSPTAQGFLSGYNTPLPLFVYELDLDLPDVLSAGVSYQPSERWLVSGQVSHVTWSDLGKAPQFPLLDYGHYVPRSPYFGDEPADDAIQLHLGGEVRLGRSERPLTLRAGAWTDPDHDTVRAIDSDQTHLAVGAGKALARGWSLDGAVRVGDTVTEGLLALGYRF